VGTLIPAATVILGRDHAASLEVLMLRRDSRLAFAGGMWVFPGGRLDPEDFGDALDDQASAEQRAAAREAHEECGLQVDSGAMHRWSHWTPPDMGQDHRFSTAFFVGSAPDGDITIDDGEIRDFTWETPAGAMDLHQAGEIELAPPTFITLCQLAAVGSVSALLDVAETSATEHFTTQIARTGPERADMVALYHGDIAYDHHERVADSGPHHRLVMQPGGWHYDRDT
jgi:8-oxo-dGTP pyrophosphatase MutT (NUDIX family)